MTLPITMPATSSTRRSLPQRLASALLLAMSFGAGAATAAPGETPNQVVETAANELARRVEGRQAELEANPQALYDLVNDVFLPVFDTDYAARLVLGRHGRTATPAQRKQFIDAFYDFLLRSYARYVLRFEKDKVRIMPPGRNQPGGDRALVQTKMALADGKQIPVDYSLRQTPAGWKAFDVRIEGVSYVQNYRNQFDAEIAQKGLDAVIARLQADAAAVSTALPQVTTPR
jgi:phospholipid transport system substrate-binding protein